MSVTGRAVGRAKTAYRILLTLALALTGLILTAPPAHAAVARSKSTPVVLVHGYSSAACPGYNVTSNYWGGLYVTLAQGGWTGPLLPVSYYACDVNGVDVTGYGPGSVGTTPQITKSQTRDGFTTAAPIDEIAQNLAWFVYVTYSKSGQPVNLVGHSMGGLIVRSALLRVQQHDPAFPPSLLVTDVVTISTPHKGIPASTASSACQASASCQSMITGSPYLTSLGTSVPQGSGGTDWTLVGSGTCDLVPGSSALGLWPAHLVQYIKPCYAHTAYLWDYATTGTAAAYYLHPGAAWAYTAAGQHSLRFVRTAMETGSW